MAVYWHSPLSNITTLKHAAKEHPYDALIGHEPASDPFYKHLPRLDYQIGRLLYSLSF